MPLAEGAAGGGKAALTPLERLGLTPGTRCFGGLRLAREGLGGRRLGGVSENHRVVTLRELCQSEFSRAQRRVGELFGLGVPVP